MKCERCHKERDEATFRKVHNIGPLCSLCCDDLEVFIRDEGEAAAKAWIYMPRNDLIQFIEKPNSTVLDCGCWAGYTMEALRNLGHMVYGLDIEDNRTVAKDLPFIQHDFDAPVVLGISAQFRYFDYIILGDILEHLKHPIVALIEIKARLQNSGRIIISVPNMGWIGSVLRLVNQEAIQDESGHFDRTHLRYYTLPTLIDTVKEAGLRPVAYACRQLPESPAMPEGRDRATIKWANVAIDCDRELLDMLNCYQILMVCEAND